MEYEVMISPEVLKKIQGVVEYIRIVYGSEQSAEKAANEIFNELEKLKTLPERGFDADEKVGQIIFPPHNSRGIVLNEYLAFYQIVENTVRISHLVPVRSNYKKFF